MKLSRRNVIEQLKATRVDQPLEDDVAESLAARLRSLAVSGAQLEEVRRGRVGRKLVAVVGSLGVFAWLGVTGVAASVGLVVTGNMPAPVQNAVSTVLEVAGIEIPRADDETTPAIDEQSIDENIGDDPATTTTSVVDQGITESQVVVLPVPTETTLPAVEEVVEEETPTTIARPVGNKPATIPSNDNAGNGGNSGNANGGNAGNSGNSGNAGQGNGANGANSETVVTAPAVLAPLMPVNEPPRGNTNNQGNSPNKSKNK